jgi:hypothetical protein
MGDASAGFPLSLSSAVQLVLRGGIEIDSYEDDELDVSVITFPLMTGGLQITTDVLFVELAPRAGTTLRAVYAPGDESEGRRHFRRSRVALSWGGAALFSVPFAYFEGSVARVEEDAGLWLERASACGFFEAKGGITLCGWGQAWHGPVIGEDGVRDVSSLAGGVSVGFGDSAD